MVLVDTSVWVQHFRIGNRHLSNLLVNGRVSSHPFVIGECALGSLKNRTEILTLMNALPKTPHLDDEEVLQFIESRHLMGRGIGLVDVHLAASAKLGGVQLWTLDKKLAVVASELDLLFHPAFH
jgi:predicted nucleic acid-binding protein